MKILLLEPYFTGSHKSWAEGYQSNSAHEIKIISLPGQFWKWRMHGGAITIAKEFLQSDFHPDLILATDMLDLTSFISLTRKRTSHIPTVLYFHENQQIIQNILFFFLFGARFLSWSMALPWIPKPLKQRN